MPAPYVPLIAAQSAAVIACTVDVVEQVWLPGVVPLKEKV
jgi:hypothetical protein